MRCRVCNENCSDKVYDIGFRCYNCLSISSNSRVTPEVYSTGNYAAYRISKLERIYIRMSTFIRTFGMTKEEHKSWLDIGCGKGTLLFSLMRRFRVYGVEPESSRSDIAKSLIGNDRVYGSLDQVQFRLDVISAYHVLEHLDEPNDLFDFISSKLNHGGVAIIEVPNKGSLQAIISKAKWPHWDKGIHRTHFSSKGIALLANNNNLKIKKIRTFSLTEGVIGMLSTILYLEGLQVYTLIKKSVLMKVILLPMFFLALILEVLASLCRRGGVLRFKLVRV